MCVWPCTSQIRQSLVAHKWNKLRRMTPIHRFGPEASMQKNILSLVPEFRTEVPLRFGTSTLRPRRYCLPLPVLEPNFLDPSGELLAPPSSSYTHFPKWAKLGSDCKECTVRNLISGRTPAITPRPTESAHRIVAIQTCRLLNDTSRSDPVNGKLQHSACPQLGTSSSAWAVCLSLDSCSSQSWPREQRQITPSRRRWVDNFCGNSSSSSSSSRRSSG